jgi:hypothetical protein
MPPKQPTLLDLLKAQGEGMLDPELMIPALGAASVVGVNQIKKRLPGAAAKAAPVIGAAAQKVGTAAQKVGGAAQSAFRTGMPFIDKALTSAKVAYDLDAAPLVNKYVKPLVRPVRQAVGKVAAGPLGKVASAYNTKIASPIKNFTGSLTKGAPGLAQKSLTAISMSGATGDPYQADEGIRRTQLTDNIMRRYITLSDPSYLEKMLTEPKGREKAEFILTDFKNQLASAGLPDQAVKHIVKAMHNPSAMDLSDHDSIKMILKRFMPTNSTFNDSTFRQQPANSVAPMDLVNSVGMNIPDIAANAIPALGLLASGGRVNISNPLFDELKNSASRGGDAIGRYNDTRRQAELVRLDALMQNPNVKPEDRLSLAQARQQLMFFDAQRSKLGY